MANGQDVAGVGTGGTAQAIGELLSGMMVACRARPFPRAANGLAKACSDERAAHVRGEMQREGGSPHWEGIFALALCDLQDGVAPERVRSVFSRALAEIDDRIERAESARPLRIVSANEQRMQGPVDVAQVTMDENDPASLARLIDTIDRYVPEVLDLRTAAEQRLVIVAAQPRQMVGRRRGSLALHTTAQVS